MCFLVMATFYRTPDLFWSLSLGSTTSLTNLNFGDPTTHQSSFWRFWCCRRCGHCERHSSLRGCMDHGISPQAVPFRLVLEGETTERSEAGNDCIGPEDPFHHLHHAENRHTLQRGMLWTAQTAMRTETCKPLGEWIAEAGLRSGSTRLMLTPILLRQRQARPAAICAVDLSSMRRWKPLCQGSRYVLFS